MTDNVTEVIPVRALAEKLSWSLPWMARRYAACAWKGSVSQSVWLPFDQAQWSCLRVNLFLWYFAMSISDKQ